MSSGAIVDNQPDDAGVPRTSIVDTVLLDPNDVATTPPPSTSGTASTVQPPLPTKPMGEVDVNDFWLDPSLQPLNNNKGYRAGVRYAPKTASNPGNAESQIEFEMSTGLCPKGLFVYQSDAYKAGKLDSPDAFMSTSLDVVFSHDPAQVGMIEGMLEWVKNEIKDMLVSKKWSIPKFDPYVNELTTEHFEVVSPIENRRKGDVKNTFGDVLSLQFSKPVTVVDMHSGKEIVYTEQEMGSVVTPMSLVRPIVRISSIVYNEKNGFSVRFYPVRLAVYNCRFPRTLEIRTNPDGGVDMSRFGECNIIPAEAVNGEKFSLSCPRKSIKMITTPILYDGKENFKILVTNVRMPFDLDDNSKFIKGNNGQKLQHNFVMNLNSDDNANAVEQMEEIVKTLVSENYEECNPAGKKFIPINYKSPMRKDPSGKYAPTIRVKLPLRRNSEETHTKVFSATTGEDLGDPTKCLTKGSEMHALVYPTHFWWDEDNKCGISMEVTQIFLLNPPVVETDPGAKRPSDDLVAAPPAKRQHM